MNSVSDFPPEILHVVLRLATEFDNPGALESPLIDWAPNETALFRRSARLRAEALATKASLVRVCRQWNAIATPLLYEHVCINSRQKLASILETLGKTSVVHANLAPLVKRLDVELAETAATFHDETLVCLLSSFPTLVTLVMSLGGMNRIAPILDAIPPSIKSLYWKCGESSVGSLRAAVSFSGFTHFLTEHPELVTMAFPFRIRSWPFLTSEKPYPATTEWFLQDEDQIPAFDILHSRGLLPNVQSRLLTWPLESRGMEMVVLASGSLRVTPLSQIPGLDTFEPNPTITRFSLVETFENPFPSDSLAHKLRVISRQCPNLHQLDLTLLSDTADLFSASVYRSTYPLPRLGGVTTLSIQRVCAAPFPDPIGSLHCLIRFPLWTDIFPSLNTIRIVEDVDLHGAKTCSTLAFAREKRWTIRIENRFGESLIT